MRAWVRKIGVLMKSLAAIGDHPIHPALITVPIGAFVLALISDICNSATGDRFWYQFSFYCIGIGVRMSAKGRRLATIHMLLNLFAVLLYIIGFFLRRNYAAFHTGRWPLVMGLEVLAVIVLGTSGWLGGKMTFVHKIGVVENADT